MEKFYEHSEQFERIATASELAQLAIINSATGVYDASLDEYVTPEHEDSTWISE